MAESVGPTTPIELVQEVYAKYPKALAEGRRNDADAGLKPT